MNRSAFSFKYFFSLLIFLGITYHSFAQDHSHFENYYNKTILTNKTGMYTLGAWAVGNIALGTYGYLNYSGEEKYFHQMNALWNTVNLGLALTGLINDKYTDFEDIQFIEHNKRMERIFLINAGLDIIYIGAGMALLKMDQDKIELEHQFNGYGKSLILQGGFLFVFDLIMYGIKKKQRTNYLSNFQLSPASEMTGFRLIYNF